MAQSQIPLWLDCDPGHDDAFAILFAAYHPALQLLGVSTVHGNASLRKTTNNALSVLRAIGRSDITVYPGASKPFCREHVSAPDIHGESGLDGTSLLPQPSVNPSSSNAIVAMRDALMNCPPNTAWLVATGTLTNIGLLFATFPEVAEHIRGLSIMGGAVGEGFTQTPIGPSFVDDTGQQRPRIGNTTPYAEFNIWCDPEAASSVLSHPVLATKIILISLDVTHQAFAGKEIQDLLLHGGVKTGKKPSRLRKMFNELLMFFTHTYAEVFGLTEGPPLHDPLAVAVLLADHADANVRIAIEDNGGERFKIDVKIEGVQIGRTLLKRDEIGSVVPRSLDMSRFWLALEYCMTLAEDSLPLEEQTTGAS